MAGIDVVRCCVGCIGLDEEASEDFCMDGNGNGRVDVDDLLLVLANFGKAC